MPKPPSLALIALSLALAGCAVGPDYHRPDIALPELFSGQAPSGTSTPSLAQKNWREVFTDPVLQGLIDEALSSGPDALLAMARIQEAEALAGVSRAPLLPHASASLNTSPTARLANDRFSSTYLGGVGISWEIDLWGRYRRAREAAQADLLASIDARYGMQTSLIASVARLYYQLLNLHGTVEITQRSIDNQREVLELVRRLSAAGISSAAEERQQESALAATEANLPSLKRQIAEAENGLSLLLGKAPGSYRFAPPTSLELPARIPAGLPSQLLEQRPDIRQAEARLVAANAKVGEAKALFFPALSLTAMFGGISTSLSDTLHGRAPDVASVGPGLLLPIFSGGQLYFNRKAAEARLEQALIAYRRTILNALGEVANGLTAYSTSAEQIAIQTRRTAASREAMRLAELRFRAGTTSFLEVLDTQRQWLAAETQYLQTVLDRRQALINVYLALGGGWGDREEPAAPPASE